MLTRSASRRPAAHVRASRDRRPGAGGSSWSTHHPAGPGHPHHRAPRPYAPWMPLRRSRGVPTGVPGRRPGGRGRLPAGWLLPSQRTRALHPWWGWLRVIRTLIVYAARQARAALPTPGCEQLPGRHRSHIQARHRLAKSVTPLGDDVRLVEVGCGRDDRLCVRDWIVALENAAADEIALAAELHHQRRVSGSRNAAGREIHDRQLAGPVHLLDEVEGRSKVLSFRHQLLRTHRRDATDATLHGAHVTHRLNDVAGPGLAFGADHRGAF